MTRRKFITRMVPGFFAAPVAQYGFSEPLPPPGADTPENLTIRVTSLEVRDSVMLAMMSEMAKSIRQLSAKFGNPGPHLEPRARAT